MSLLRYATFGPTTNSSNPAIGSPAPSFIISCLLASSWASLSSSLTSFFLNHSSCSHTAVLLPSTCAAASFCGFACATFNVFPASALWSRLSIAAFASSGDSNSTYAKPRWEEEAELESVSGRLISMISPKGRKSDWRVGLVTVESRPPREG